MSIATAAGCVVVVAGLMICQPGNVITKFGVTGEDAIKVDPMAAALYDLSRDHAAIWGNLTDEKIEAAFADWGPRRHIPVDWSKVKGYQP